MKIISGGQTGADQGGLRGAKRIGIPTGGWAPKNWWTEDGSQPTLLQSFGLLECPVPGYPARTLMNAQEADLTFWFGRQSPGYWATKRSCKQAGRPMFELLVAGTDTLVDTAVKKLTQAWANHLTVNIAGNRESTHPGIGLLVETFIVDTLGPLVGTPTEDLL